MAYATLRYQTKNQLCKQDLKISDLFPLFGSIELVDKVISGEMEVTKEQAKMLGI